MANLALQRSVDFAPLWNNGTNLNFYNAINPSVLKEFAEKAGLISTPDVMQIKQLIHPCTKILEIGGGYGRVKNALLKHSSFKHLTVIERNIKFYNKLLEDSNSNVSIINNDIRQFVTREKYDVILLLWSGIFEFQPMEQGHLIQKLSKALNSNGLIIIDALPEDSSSSQYLSISYNNHLICGYNPLLCEIKSYAQTADLKLFKKICYKTDNQKERLLYILKK